MSLLVVGSVAFDTILTPHGERVKALGGSASYFSYSASFFTDVRLVGIVGGDFPEHYRKVLESRPIDTSGLTTDTEGKTFHWTGKYHQDMNIRDTVNVELNVLNQFKPELSEEFARSKYIFLANDSPTTQMAVLEQCTNPKLVVCDTMNLWIKNQLDDLKQLMTKVNGIVLNDEEAKMLTDQPNLVIAGEHILEMGPEFVVIKKGEHGVLMVIGGAENEGPRMLVLPALPLRDVVDPTGAGDTFAGGMMGYLASVGGTGDEQLKRSLAYGTVMASINVEGFSLDNLQQTTQDEIEQRYHLLSKMLQL